MRFLLSILLMLAMTMPVEGALRRLRQSTDTTVELHLVNASTGAGITSATVTSITAFIKKHSNTSSSTKTDLTITASAGSNDAVEVGLGDYNLELTAAQLDTLGALTLCYSYTAAVTTCDSYEVIANASYDATIAGNIASVTDVFSEPVPGSYLAGQAGYIIGNNLRYLLNGTADSGTTTTLVDAALTQADTDYFKGNILCMTSGNAVGQCRTITAFTPASDTITFSPALTQAVSTDTYEIRPSGAVNLDNLIGTLDAAEIGTDAITASKIAADAIGASEIADGAIDAGAIAADAITAAKIAADAIGASEIAAGAITSSEAPNLDATISSRASQTSLDTTAGYVDTEVAAIKTKTDFLPSATAGSAGGVFIAGTNAATTVTTAFTTTFTGNLTGSVASVTGAVGSVTGSVGGNVGGNVTGNVTGTIGGLTAAALKDFFDTDTTTTYASSVAGSVVKEITDNSGGAGFTVQNIVDGVWNEATAGHQTAGTTGKALTDASSAGDPWTSALSGYTTPGTAGYVLNTNLNTTVSSRATQTSVDDVQTDTNDIQTRLPAALVSGRMDSSTGAMASNVITAAAINGDAFTAAKFAADVSTEFAATLMATTFEGSNTFKHFLQYGAAALFGKYNSSAGTFNFRDLADSKNRIVYTTSSTARTSVTLSPD